MAKYTEYELNNRLKKLAYEMFQMVPDKGITISKRMKNTYACIETKMERGVKYFLGFKAASFFVESDEYSEEAIDDVLKHELVHWYVETKDNSMHHGHDAEFRAICKKHGVSAKGCEDICKIGETPKEQERVKLKPNEYHEMGCVSCGLSVIKSKNHTKMIQVQRKYWPKCPRCGCSLLEDSKTGVRYRSSRTQNLTDSQIKQVAKNCSVFVQNENTLALDFIDFLRG